MDPTTGFEGLRSIQTLKMLAGPMAAEHEREVDVVGCGRLERWSLLITMSLPITQTGFRPVILKCAAWILEHCWILFSPPCQVVNCTLLMAAGLKPWGLWRSTLSWRVNLFTWPSYTGDTQSEACEQASLAAWSVFQKFSRSCSQSWSVTAPIFICCSYISWLSDLTAEIICPQLFSSS